MLELAKKLAVTAGKKIAKQYNKSHTHVRYKSMFEPTVAEDTETEEYLKREIRKKFPTHGILGEEGTNIEPKNGYLWVIDPLDGTINFIRGFPYFSVSIAVLKNMKPHIGVVYNPMSGELFYAQKGEGAYCNKRKICVSDTKKLSDAYFSTGFRYKRGKEFTKPLKKIKVVLEKVLVVRRTGSASLDLCQVAAGRFDGFFMTDTKKWDVYAGLCIVKEAGGKYDIKEKREQHNLDVIATNGKLQPQLKRLLRWE